MAPEILRSTDHRPWPLPARPWVMGMSWQHLAFLHWRVPAATMARHLPAGLEVDTHDGSAWLGVVPFFMSHVRARGCPGFPTTNRFLELNLRTYVVRNGRPGVWFFSLDANSWLAVRGARLAFHLPYFDADMDADVAGDVAYRSRRTHRGAVPGNFRAIYGPTGDVFRSRAGTLEHWLTERYSLYSADRRGRIYCGEIHHPPWPLQPATVSLRENTLGDLVGVELDPKPASVLYSERLDVVAWALNKCS